jgi:hypothetical protein
MDHHENNPDSCVLFIKLWNEYINLGPEPTDPTEYITWNDNRQFIIYKLSRIDMSILLAEMSKN